MITDPLSPTALSELRGSGVVLIIYCPSVSNVENVMPDPSPDNPLPLFAVWPETLDVGESGYTFAWRDRAVLKRLRPGDQGWAPRPWPTAPGHITEYLLLACGAVIVRNEFRHNISYKGKARFHDEISQQYGIRLDGCYEGSIDRDPTPAAEARELLRKKSYRHFLDC